MRFLLLASLTLLVPVQPAEAQSARCDPASISRWPRLLLIGEDHSDKGSISVKNSAIELGEQGLLFVGLEGAFPGTGAQAVPSGRASPSSRVYGVDSYLNHGLIFSYFFVLGREYPGNSRREMLDIFVKSLAKNPFMSRSWEALRSRGPLDPELERMARNIDFARSVAWSIPLNGQRDFDDISILARLVHADFIASANSTYLGKIGRESPLEPTSPADLDYLMHESRDRALGENIADVYCDAAKEGRNMAAVVGDGHVEGIRRLLLEWSGGRLPFETGRSFESPAEVALRLAALARAPLAPSPSDRARNSSVLSPLLSNGVSFDSEPR